MDDAVRARAAARDALADVDPEPLREALDERLAGASMTPGVLALLSARALAPDVAPDDVVDRAAGVQLIYEGLRLTRSLAQTAPWENELQPDIDADLDVIAADVLVSRGFYLLARTGAADRAVETVRAFGRDQTLRRRDDADHDRLDRNLESDVFSLAVVAGTTAVGGEAPDRLLAYADELARGFDGDLPPATVALPETALDRIATLSDDRVPSSATDG